MLHNIDLRDFQEEVVEDLMNRTVDSLSNNTKDTVYLEAPTGAGKTVMLASYVSQIQELYNDVCIVWFSPGAGELEEQSADVLEGLGIHTKGLKDVLRYSEGFRPEFVTVINWEKVSAKSQDNTVKVVWRRGDVTDSFGGAIAKAKLNYKFIVIVDECHLNKTSISEDILSLIGPEFMIEASATLRELDKKDRTKVITVDEQQVIEAGLMTKLLYINDGIDLEDLSLDDMYKVLLNKAYEKRNKLIEGYESLSNEEYQKIRPLILVQFPNNCKGEDADTLIKAVEEHIEETFGCSYENKQLAKWLDKDKINIDKEFLRSYGGPVFLLFKQAINVGWDCPRAKVLVKLRKGDGEVCEKQTFGRIRRTVIRGHFNEVAYPELDMSYLYTDDDKYKQSIINEVVTVKIAKTFRIRDEFRDELDFKLYCAKTSKTMQEYDDVNKNKLVASLCEFFKSKYHLEDTNRRVDIRLRNNEKLSYYYNLNVDYIQSNVIINQSVKSLDELDNIQTVTANTIKFVDKNKIYKFYSRVSKLLGISEKLAKSVLSTLFFSKSNSSKYLLTQILHNFDYFIYNNQVRLYDDLKEFLKEVYNGTKLGSYRYSDIGDIENKPIFRFKETVELNYDGSLGSREFTKSLYKGYGEQCWVKSSIPEKRCERFFETCEEVEWFFKNGDKGDQYFSVTYSKVLGMVDTGKNSLNFYPDYIVKTKDGHYWILEVKGGWSNSFASQDIDFEVSKSKFIGLKTYINSGLNDGFELKGKLHFGFIRPYEIETLERPYMLCYSDTEYEELTKDNLGIVWKDLEDVFKGHVVS